MESQIELSEMKTMTSTTKTSTENQAQPTGILVNKKTQRNYPK